MVKQNPFSFFLSFLNTYYSPIFRKGRRKNSLSCTYLWQGLIFRFLSFMGDWHLQNRLNQCLSADFCLKILFYFFTETFPWSWLNWCLSLTNVCPELNFLFQISFNEKHGIFGLMVYWPIIWLFPSPTIPVCMTFKLHMEWSNTQYVCTPTSTILSITASTHYGLNCFGYMIYVL